MDITSPIPEDRTSKARSERWTVSVKDVFFKYVKFLPWIILSAALCVAGAFVYLRYATQYYSANATIIIDDDRSSNKSDKVDDILLGSNRSQNIVNEIEVLGSQPLMERVVNRLNLNFQYESIGKIKKLDAYKETPFTMEASSISDSSAKLTFHIRFSGTNTFTVNDSKEQYSFGQSFKTRGGQFRLVKISDGVPGSEYNVSWYPGPSIALSFLGNLKVIPKRSGSSILSIALRTTNPKLAADIVNTLMDEYRLMKVEQNNYSTDQILSFINGRLMLLNTELDSAQDKLLDFQQKNDLINIDLQSEEYFARMAETDKLSSEQRLKLNDAVMVEEYLRDKQNRFSRVVVPSTLGIEDRTLAELVDAYNKAQLNRQSLLDGNIPVDNPAVRQAEGQIETIRASVLENLVNIKSSMNQAIASINRTAGVTQSNIKSLPIKIKELFELRRQVDLKLELVKSLEGKREEAAIARASTISNSKIINPADPNATATPVAPNRRAVQLFGLLIGLGIPTLILLIRELLNDRVNSRSDVERITRVPIVGEIGHSYDDKVLVVTSSSRLMVSEQFRGVRSNLQYIINNVERPVIMVTSSFSGEGKSFISTNLGAVMALAGKKTIILEFDIRKPKVLHGLKMGKARGINNYILGQADLDELIVKIEGSENLYVLPCGPIPPNPAEQLLDKKVEELFAELRTRFDVVVVDTAPVGMVSDAVTLGKFADATVYLVRQGYTYKKQIFLIDELYREEKLPRISLVINDVTTTGSYGYYGYGRYGYSYGQKNSYYDDDVRKPGFWQRLLKPFKRK